MSKDKDELYDSMANHDDIKPIMDKMAAVAPDDEWGAAVCLVRNCFSSDGTERSSARRELQRLIRGRNNLQKAFENAVCRAGDSRAFWAASVKLGGNEMDAIRSDYAAQLNELMGRK